MTLNLTRKNILLPVAALTLLIATLLLLFLLLTLPLRAANLSVFDPGNIMSDSVMSNKDTMSVEHIQTFLRSKNPCNNTNIKLAQRYPHLTYNIRNGKFVCMAEETFNGETAAQIIWQAAQDYTINPRVIIVLLEKEQGLITDTWPNHIQYRSATGFGCPDTAACDSQYYGLKNQVRHAAKLFRSVLDGGWTNYPVGPNYIRFSPVATCGGTTVNVKNRATSALYRYTPYQPNQAALRAGYGLGDNCSAYGNRNFYALFTDWFGSTDDGVYIDILEATKHIDTTHHRHRDALGKKTNPVAVEYDTTPRAWQGFERGSIIWTRSSGAQAVLHGPIYNRWRLLGGSLGTLGVPTSHQVIEADGRVWQSFDKGVVIYSEKTGAWEILPGPIGNAWRRAGGSLGALGKPTSAVTIGVDGRRQQAFEKGVIVRRNITSPAIILPYGKVYDIWESGQQTLGVPTSHQVIEADGRVWQSFDKGVVIYKNKSAHPVYYDSFYTPWRLLGGSLGTLGVPTSHQVIEADGRVWQSFDKGVMLKSPKSSNTAFAISGPIYNRWRLLGGSLGTLGVPTSHQVIEADGRVWQSFDKGVVIYSEKTGAWEILFGAIHTTWRQSGGSLGRYGKPIAAQTISGTGIYQRFENGIISR